MTRKPKPRAGVHDELTLCYHCGLHVELVKRHETKMLVAWLFLLAVALGWFLLTRPSYRIEGDFLYHEDERNLSDGWVAEQMRSSIAENRARACLSLGRIGDPASLDLLLEALQDAIPRVRAAAAFAIGLIEDRESLVERGLTPDPRARQALIAALDDRERLVVTRTVEALGKVGWPDAFPRIGQTAAPIPITMTALVRLESREAIPWIVLHLRSDDQDTRRAALFALNELEAPLDQDITRSMLNFTKDINLWVRIAAVQALGRAQATPEVVEKLAAMTQDRDPKVRIEALRSLGNLHWNSSLAVLAARLDDENENVRRAAVDAMGALGNREALPIVQPLRFQASPVAYEAEQTVAVLAHSDAEFFNGVDDFPAAYASAEGIAGFARALGRLGSPKAIEWLRRLWNGQQEEMPDAKPALLRVLAGQSLPDFENYLEQSLQDSDVRLRLAALELMHEPPVETCRRLYEEAPDADAGGLQRRAALEAAARALDTPERKVLLVQALDDQSRQVRMAAVKHLRLLYGEDHVEKIGLARAAYERSEYQRIARTIGWRAVMETSAGVLEIAFDYDNAALTSEHFLELARQGAFDGMHFSDVTPAEWIELNGPPVAPQRGAAGELRSEISPQPFLRGSLALASPGPFSGGAFFVILSPQLLWDSRLTNFGRFTSGDNVLDRITEDTRILRVTVP